MNNLETVAAAASASNLTNPIMVDDIAGTDCDSTHLVSDGKRICLVDQWRMHTLGT